MDTIKRHKHVQILDDCARLGTHSTSYDVAKCLREYIQVAIPDMLIRENRGFDNSPEQVYCFMHKNCSGYWVVIIKNDDVKKYGRDCITAYHMRSAITFSDAYAFPNYHAIGFCNSYEALCDRSPNLLYRYDTHLSCEALVSQMLCMRYEV